MPDYVVVTPARDEARYIGDLAESLLAQSVPFDRWIVVDDGSSDGTQEIVRDYASKDPRIQLVERDGRGKRYPGCGDLVASVVGLNSLPDIFIYDYIAKIDADLVLPADYFERLFSMFAADERLGILGGHCYVPTSHGLVLDKVPDDHVNGATKVYRRECLREIWPLDEVWGWDTIDECRAQMAGWTTLSVKEPGVIHQKPMSGGAGGLVRGNFLIGRMSHFLGYRPEYLLLRVARHLFIKPVLVGSLAMAAGYVAAAVRREPRFANPEFITYLRGQQLARMRGMLSMRGASESGGAK